MTAIAPTSQRITSQKVKSTLTDQAGHQPKHPKFSELASEGKITFLPLYM